MQRRYNLAYFILASVVVLSLTPLMVCVDAQAQIAFASDRDGNFEIYVMDTDGKKPQRLTINLFRDEDPSWSPNGKRIIFVSDRDGNREIYVMDANGENQQRLTNTGNNWSPSWSPNGERIAFTSHRDMSEEIYVMDADGGNPQNLSNNPFFDWRPSWSPDGERIAFVSARNGWENIEIYVMDADGGNPRRLTKNHHNDVGPALFGPAFAVAPAGKKLTIWGWFKQGVR